MNDAEFERRIARIMNDNVDQQLRVLDRRRPAFDAGRVPEQTRRYGRLVLPLAAAAAVAAITVGAVALSGSSSPHHPARPAGTTQPVPRPTASVPTTPLTHAATTPHGASKAAKSHPTVTLGGAHVVLPVGWVDRDLGTFGNSTYAHVWCLLPAGQVLGPNNAGCPVTLTQIDPNDNEIDVDIQGGLVSNPHYCFAGANRKTVEQAGDRQFGGRVSDWRHWSVTCTGHDFELEQYVVATNPGFIMYSEVANATVRAAMAEIAQNSTLPAQTSSLRLMDRGYLRSATVSGPTVHVVIDRAIPLDPSGVINNNPATYSYDVPLSTYSAASVKVGDMVAVYTNGNAVRDFYKSTG